MSMQSYARNCERGIAGPGTGTELLAAFDQLTLKGGVSPETYIAYSALFKEFTSEVGNDPYYIPPGLSAGFRKVRERALQEIGSTTSEMIECRVTTAAELAATLGELAAKSYRTVLYMRDRRKGQDDLWPCAVSQFGPDDMYPSGQRLWALHIPYCEPHVEDVMGIFQHLDQSDPYATVPGGPRYQQTSNVFAIPPEPSGY